MQTYAPKFKIEANDKDITALIASRFSSLRLTDETGFNSDTLEVVLSDTDDMRPVKIPPTGAELRLWIWYGDAHPVDKGLFVCNEVELSGWPATITLRANAAPYDGTPKGKLDFQTQKSRSWPAGTTLGAMVGKMAAEHGMKGVTSPELTGVVLPHIDQSDESDINLLIRLARRYDAIVKPGGGKLIFAKRGNAKKVSGADMHTLTLRRSDVSNYRMTLARRDSAGTVVAFYRDNRTASRHQVSIGSGDPVRRLRMGFKNAVMATAAVKAEIARRARGETRLSVSMPGRPDMTAETNLAMGNDFRDGIAGDWLVTRVEHSITKGGGYTCSVDAEKPNSDPDVEDATSGDVIDTVRASE
jgi:uncharacterized protein